MGQDTPLGLLEIIRGEILGIVPMGFNHSSNLAGGSWLITRIQNCFVGLYWPQFPEKEQFEGFF